MVDSRFRRRTFQRASLGIRTPCQTRTPELFFPAGEKPWVDADHPGAYDLARRLCASCESCQWCLAIGLGPPRKLRHVGRHNAGRASPDPRRQPGDHRPPGTRVPMSVASRSDHPAQEKAPGGRHRLNPGCPSAIHTRPPGTVYRTPRPERIMSDQHSRNQQAPCPGGRRRNDDDLRPPTPAPPDTARPGGRRASSHRPATPTGPTTVARPTSPTRGAEEQDMRGTDSSVSKDPIETLTRRARRAWRRSERQIVAEHRNVVASRLRQLATTPASPPGHIQTGGSAPSRSSA